MIADVALFWLVLGAFLLADHLVLAPAGGDFLKFGFGGRLRYEPRVRLKMRGRDLVMLNPLHPFDRLVLTRHAAGRASPAQVREATKQVRRALRPLNRLAVVGAAYLVVLVALVLASFEVAFVRVLVALAAVHLLAWSVSMALLFAGRRALGLPASRLVSLGAEAFFVPAYTVNLSRRLAKAQVLDVPAMAWGLRALRRIADPSLRELYGLRLSGRLDDVVAELDLDDDTPLPAPASAHRQALGRWVEEARACLTASAARGGW